MVPITIQNMAFFLGSGLTGARVYVGASEVSFAHPERDKDCECRPSRTSFFHDGVLDSEVHISFYCNGKRGEVWTFFVSYEPDDTFTVRLLSRRGMSVKMLAERRDIYNSELQGTVEDVYDDAIKTHCDGFITLS